MCVVICFQMEFREARNFSRVIQSKLIVFDVLKECEPIHYSCNEGRDILIAQNLQLNQIFRTFRNTCSSNITPESYLSRKNAKHENESWTFWKQEIIFAFKIPSNYSIHHPAVVGLEFNLEPFGYSLIWYSIVQMLMAVPKDYLVGFNSTAIFFF